jgi:hypothetical protein
MKIQFKAKIEIFLILFCLFTASCQSGTLIEGELTENDLRGFTPDDFKGQTIYIYPESEIKDFFERKKTDFKESISRLNLLQKKCDELTRKIPIYDRVAVLQEHDKAEKLASDCDNEHKFAQENLSQIYFENIPQTKLTTTINEDGSFAVRVPPNRKYVFILPKHSITWINATGSRKFLMLSAGLDPNADVVL